MAKFTYNNAKNANTGNIPFKLNFGYHLSIFFEENTNPRSWSKIVNKLSTELKKLIIICWENLYRIQEF